MTTKWSWKEGSDQYWIEELKATLNMVVPTRTRQERYEKYYVENSKLLIEKQAKYVAENAEKVRERHAKWYAKNAEIVLEKQAKYYSDNAEKVRDRHAKYRAENRDVINALARERYALKKQQTQS